MKRVGIVVFLMGLLFSSVSLANSPQTKQEKFIAMMSASVEEANAHISRERQTLTNIYHSYKLFGRISSSETIWVQQLAQKYKLTSFDINKQSQWYALLRRVDIVPTSLAVAQAINESAWGTSRFAKEGNNYYGQWCYVKGCGIVPARRPAGKTYEVKAFRTPEASVESYLLNINTHQAYRELRDLRFELRQSKQPLTGITLSKGLENYSQKGDAYIKILDAIIVKYDLTQYDA